MKYQNQSKDLIEGGPRATGNTEDTGGGRPPLNNEIGSTYRTRLRASVSATAAAAAFRAKSVSASKITTWRKREIEKIPSAPPRHT